MNSSTKLSTIDCEAGSRVWGINPPAGSKGRALGPEPEGETLSPNIKNQLYSTLAVSRRSCALPHYEFRAEYRIRVLLFMQPGDYHS